MATGRQSPPSYAPFTDEHLRRLVRIAEADQKSFFQRNPHLAVYGHRLLSIALCQGGALHYLDCKKGAKKTNGVKDLDVYSFYADDPEIPWPYRRHGVADFGASEFGHHPNKRRDFVGRHVYLMGRALPVAPGANPVLAIRDWLATSNNKTPRLCVRRPSWGCIQPSTLARSSGTQTPICCKHRGRSADPTKAAPPPCQW